VKSIPSALLLVALAVGAAACGSMTSSKTALREARDYGGTQPSVTRVERWRIANGDAVDVVLVRARFCGTRSGVTMPKVHGRCLPTEVYFAVRPGAPSGFANFLGHGSARLVAKASKARRAFGIFPDFPGLLVRCNIPRGGGGTVAGLCEAKLSGSGGVDFLEHWPLSKPPGRRTTGGWVVTFDPSGRAVVHGTGSTPLQSQSS
jgi:hypothetical protein